MKEETNITAVAWLVAELITNGNLRISLDGLNAVAVKALEMEEEQHSKTWERGSYSLLDHGSGEDFEQYFKETYGRD